MSKTLGLIVSWLMLSGGICAAQSSFQELTPGTSTRQDAVNALGQPVRTASPTVAVYAGSAGIQQVEVEYAASGVIDRIDVVLQQPVTRAALVDRFGLPAQSMSQKQTSDGKLIEYFGVPALVAFVYASRDVSGGVVRIGHYSPKLFAATVGVPLESVEPAMPAATGAGAAAKGCLTPDQGIQSGDDSDNFVWAKRQSAGALMPFITTKIQMLFQCPSLTEDQLSSAYADLSTVRVWDKAPLSDACFGGDHGVLNTTRAGHKAFAQSRSRAELTDRMQTKVRTAFACLSKERTWQNYLIGDISAAITRAAGF